MNRRCGVLVGLGFCISMVFAICLAADTFAVGAVINTNGGGEMSGGGGGGGSANCGNFIYGANLVECTGVSWIYFAATGNAGNNGAELWFAPAPNSQNAVKIDAECSKPGRGFWHFGRNSLGLTDYSIASGYMIDYSVHLHGYDSSVNYTYSMPRGSWGHYDTYTQALVNQYSWIKYRASDLWTQQSLYAWNTEVYRSNKLASSYWDTDLINNYKTACKYSNQVNGTSYNCNVSSIPNDVNYFCYWGGMKDNSGISGQATAGEIDPSTNTAPNSEPSFVGYRTTGFTQKKMNSTVYTIQNCPASGCLAKLSLDLRWDKGNGQTTYYVRILRNGNWSDRYSGKVSKPTNGSTLRVRGNKNDEVKYGGVTYRYGIERMYPGDSLCYLLEYYPNGDSGGMSYAMSCVVAGTSTTAALNMKVQNSSINTGYQNSVYAKPGDSVDFKATYDPSPQSTYKSLPSKKTELWKNAFSIQQKKGWNKWSDANTIGNYTFKLGDSKTVEQTNNYGTITGNDVGSIDERAILNLNSNTTDTPSKVVGNTYDDGNINGTYYIQSALSGEYFIDVDANSKTVSLWHGMQYNNRKWKLTKNSDGTYRIESVYFPGQSIDLPGQNTSNSVQLWVYENNDTCAQKWSFVRNKDDGTYTIKSNCNNGFVVDAQGGSTEGYHANGQHVQLYESNSTDAQRWILIPANGVDGLGYTVEANKITSNTATMIVPYNFEMEVKITSNDSISIGSNKTIRFNINVNKRQNTVTKGTYATRVNDAKWRLLYRINGDRNWTEASSGTGSLNTSGNSDGNSVEKSGNIPIPDAPAGTTLRVCAQVWPKDSGEMTNASKTAYTDDWAEDCKDFVIAKKPSLQVWGGNVYSVGNINTSNTFKKMNNTWKAFGSWGELGVITSNTVNGFGSGASMGYGGMNSDGSLINTNSGANASSSNELKCVRSLLTIPNQNYCSSSAAASWTGGTALAGLISGNKNSIIKKYNLNNTPASGTYTSGNSIQIGGGEENGIYRYYNNGNFSINGIDGGIRKGATYLAYAKDKKITIEGNLDYSGIGGYAKFDELPHVIIYAKNVDIQCNVTRIDALIIAEETVNTCSGTGDDNSAERSRQLVVNGAIVAKTVNARRTYGAAQGDNSVIPAEIINFDPSLYLFGGEKGVNDATNANLKLVTIREKAPRL